MTKEQETMTKEQEIKPLPTYFKSLTVENIKCFKGKQTIDLSDGNGKYAQWTVILGDNNTGKTTLLRCLADLEPTLFETNTKEHCPNNLLRVRRQKRIGFSEKFFSVSCFTLWEKPKGSNQFVTDDNTWGFTQSSWTGIKCGNKDGLSICGLIIYGYGTARRMGISRLSEKDNESNTASLFSDDITLINAEEWLLQTDYANKNGVTIATSRLDKIKQVLTSGILPDVSDFRFTTTSELKSFVEFQTSYGWVRLDTLGYGYQTMIAWVVDLAKRLFERYPDSNNPLAESAVVLIDEIDLHLHPEWQRKIIQFLTAQFPNTQFIVTSHSPLIVQSANNINLVLLEKKGEQVTITQPEITTYKGWTIEEILCELMGLGEETLSESYLALIKQFDDALDKNDYAKAKEAYDELDKILHPESNQRKLLRISMSSLMPSRA
ncbi:AAA family ATPase [Candidatus Parabeggiatoa sp. HSG14]|uniref:AAA family ATPase n=1 Tax=Candidatus Parabeggiatoa sp. HSG14 TaxID=3055593 RepID=UPI0025A70EC7|nr:AAA family ATPase [Thiotrichales bacterium HSG14]